MKTAHLTPRQIKNPPLKKMAGSAAEEFIRNAVESIILAMMAALLAGCTSWPKEKTEFLHVNSRADALKLANAWLNPRFGRTWSTVGFTGSMRPVLNGGEVLFLQDYSGQPVRAGQIVCFNRDAGAPRCLHRLIEVRDGGAYISGDNNRNSDGWFPLTRINYVVAKVITFPR